MGFYAVGYTNGGANEKRLGPFKSKDDAMKAGRDEQGADRNFAFSGVVDESGRYVYANSAVHSTNPVVANALAARKSGTASNAGKAKVKITIKSITDRGVQTFEKTVDIDGLEAWMRSAGLGDKYQRVLLQLATEGIRAVPLTEPCHISITAE